ncbi:MAG: tyrosine-type recombinase/integrase [Melioribacteraceae bacterium]|nr:tyrosine-type recombinase/integrase [Melioribacteraceae bacterium]
MNKLLKNITTDDLDKLKTLLSIIPNIETKEIITLRVFENEYCNMIKVNRSKAYYISVCSSFKHLIMYFGSGKSISTIGLKEVENFSTYLQQNVTNGFRVYFRTLKAAFNKAKDWGYVKDNYFTKVKLPKKQKLAPAFINSEQLLAISNKIKSKIVKDVIVFAFYTGMRLAEIVNLRWKNIDLVKRVITVGDDKFTTKGRKQRFVPVCEALTLVLSTHKIKSSSILPFCKEKNIGGFVFCKDNGKGFTGDYISKQFKLACKAAGMDKSIHFHTLRHSFASNLVQNGVPLYSIKELLGHSSISTTEIYAHLNMDTLREAVKKLDGKGDAREVSPPPFGHLLPAKIAGQVLSKRENSPVKIFRINDVGI